MSSNPYAAPKAAVADQTAPGGGTFIPGGRGVAGGRGMAWITEGWGLFRQSPGLWIGITIVATLIFVVLAFIPFLGSIATTVLGPVFAGGIMLGCRALDEGGELEFSHLFAGFREKLGTLAAIGGLYLAGVVVLMVLVAVVFGAGIFAAVGMGGEQADPGTLFATMGLGILVMLALMLPLVMAVWFAAPLAVLQHQGAFDAMKGSFAGCLKNIVPFLLYGIVMLVLSVVASIPLLLGWLVLGPVLAASVYTAFRDIYFQA
jgi:uncharacterized membrane protein